MDEVVKIVHSRLQRSRGRETAEIDKLNNQPKQLTHLQRSRGRETAEIRILVRRPR